MTGKGIEKYTGSAGRSGKLRREGGDGGESADGVGSWTSICMGGGCGKVEQKAAQLMEDVRARGEGKAMLMKQGGEKILVEERARECEGEE